MIDLYIVGAGGFGREVLQWTKDVNRRNHQWNIRGFLSDPLDELDGKACDYAILGQIHNWIPKPNDQYLMAVGDPSGKKKLATLLLGKGAVFATLIHPSAQVSEFTRIGRGSIICPNAEISPNVTVGEFCSVLNAGIGHDAEIGDFSTISGGCYINGGVKIGRQVFAGSGVQIVPGRTIGDGAYLGIGSVVIRNVAAGSKVFGNPAKVVDFDL